MHQRVNFTMGVTETICERMRELGVSRADLADRMKRRRSQITKWLSDEQNMTLGTLSDILFALDCEATLQLTSSESRQAPADDGITGHVEYVSCVRDVDDIQWVAS